MKKLYSSIVAIFATAILVFLVWYFSNIVWYIITSAILALVGRPVVNALSKLHISKWYFPKWIAALATLCLILMIIFVGFNTFIPIIFNKATELSSFDVTNIMNTFSGVISKLDDVIRTNFNVGLDFSLTTMISEQITPLLNIKALNSIVASMPTVAMDASIAIFSVSFITFFFLKESSLFYDGIVVLFPKKYEENATRALEQINMLLIRYFIGLFIESVIKLIVISVGLMIMGFSMENAMLIALISAILNVIPYVGPLIGGIVGVFIGIMTPIEGMAIHSMIINMGLLFIGFQVIDNIILQPYVYSSSVKAHPLEIFIVILLAGSIAGVIGMLFAIPAYTVLRVFAKEFFNNFRLVQKLTEKI